MKKIQGIFIAAILIAVTAAFTTNVSPSKKKLAVFPSNACYVNVVEPDNCTTTVGDLICTSHDTTFYFLEGCSQVLYVKTIH